MTAATITVRDTAQVDVDSELSTAIVAYLGYGTARSPQRNMRALLALRDDMDLLCAARAAINEVLDFDDEDLHPDAVPAAVTAFANTVRPDLSETAVTAIVWNYCCGWR